MCIFPAAVNAVTKMTNMGIAIFGKFSTNIVWWSGCTVYAFCLVLLSLAAIRFFFFISQLFVAHIAPFVAINCQFFPVFSPIAKNLHVPLAEVQSANATLSSVFHR